MNRCWLLFVVLIAPICEALWRSSSEEDRKPIREERSRIHYHSKRHMLPADAESKKSARPARPREIRKKPSGHLTPLKEDDIDNDEVVSVAIGPPPMRPMYDKLNWRPKSKINTTKAVSSSSGENGNLSPGAVTIVKDVLIQIGREFLTHQVNEDFVFGQYVGQAMKNITSDHKLKFQHDILELVIKYQSLGRGEGTSPKSDDKKDPLQMFKDLKDGAKATKGAGSVNETEESWPDFTNLAKIVG